MNPLAMTWTALAVVTVLAVAPVFVVRLAARIYPKGHPRRAELVAEMQHVAGLGNALRRWYWMSETLALAVCEGLAARFSRDIGSAPVFVERRFGPAVVTVTQGPDRLHFDFRQASQVQKLDPQRLDDAATIVRMRKLAKRNRRMLPFRLIRARWELRVLHLRIRMMRLGRRMGFLHYEPGSRADLLTQPARR